MNSSKSVRFGPTSVPIVPVSHFTRFKSSDLDEVWRIIGPSVALNINQGPIWKVITAAYLEGLLHGAGLQEEIDKRGGVVSP